MNLGDDRLSTTDETGRRLFLHPAEVKGFFRRYRTFLHIFLLFVFLSIPWLKWNNVQLILLDIPNRTFILFGFLFKSHDAPLIFLLLAIFTISLALFTAVFGRVWCGWACPQTVFIDALYRQIEIWIQGKYFKRRKLQKQDLNFEKTWKLGLTWICYFIISFLIAHSFVAYFIGADRLLAMMQGSPESHKNTFLIVMSMTLILLFNFGWFREQFCIIACPYGRIQSVLMDKQTTSVLYDYNRGEPRKGLAPMESRGDCVDCRRCVEVCPTGIDIRRGIQMECIGCTACIDACDYTMMKIKKPKGLIRYASEQEIQNKTKYSLRSRILKPRVLIYAFLILVACVGFSILLEKREVVSINMLRKSASPYSEDVLPDGSKVILNHISFHIHNQSMTEIQYEMKVADADLSIEVITPMNHLTLAKNTNQNFSIIVRFPKSVLDKNGEAKIRIYFEILGQTINTKIYEDIILVGPI